MGTANRHLLSGTVPVNPPVSAVHKVQRSPVQRPLSNVIVNFTSVTGSVTVSNFVPALNTNISQTTGTISFTVTDTLYPLRAAIVHVRFGQFGSNHIELVHDGVQFSYLYSGSQIGFSPNGYQYTLTRVGGWPAPPEVIPWMVDGSGSINS